MGAVQHVYRRGATNWWRRRLIKKSGESDRRTVAIRMRTREPLIARSIAAHLTLESDRILSEGLPDMLSDQQVKWLLSTAVRNHLRKLDRVAVLERADGISAPDGRRADLVSAWAQRLYSARGLTAAVEAGDHAKIFKCGLNEDDFSEIDAVIALLRGRDVPRAKILQMLSECGATQSEGDVVAVPASLQASLMSRLDRLGSAKDVAQVGAVIGREFPHMLLAAVVQKPETELVSDINRLIAAGLLFRQGTPPHASYLFKHALVQDAAYGTLLRGPRRVLHTRIAEILENQFPEIAESQPELLARHYTKADPLEKSARMWGKAGQRSQERSALVEGAEQLSQALAQIATLPSTPDLRREQIIFQVALFRSPATARRRNRGASASLNVVRHGLQLGAPWNINN